MDVAWAGSKVMARSPAARRVAASMSREYRGFVTTSETALTPLEAPRPWCASSTWNGGDAVASLCSSALHLCVHHSYGRSMLARPCRYRRVNMSHASDSSAAESEQPRVMGGDLVRKCSSVGTGS